MHMPDDGFPAGEIRVISPRGDTTGRLIRRGVRGAMRTIRENWGLSAPRDCRIYVMNSWVNFMFQSAPFGWRILLALNLPFWAARSRRLWEFSAAWTMYYGQRAVIGIKALHLLEAGQQRHGLRLYEDESQPEHKMCHLTCHELTHACAAPLNLPQWLDEGLAQLTVDDCMANCTMRTDTLDLLRRYHPKTSPPGPRELAVMDSEALVYQNVRSYWLLKYLEELSPGYLKRNLSSPQVASLVVQELSRWLDLPEPEFWQLIDDRLIAHFEQYV